MPGASEGEDAVQNLRSLMRKAEKYGVHPESTSESARSTMGLAWAHLLLASLEGRETLEFSRPHKNPNSFNAIFTIFDKSTKSSVD